LAFSSSVTWNFTVADAAMITTPNGTDRSKLGPI
jgi:hypothetical protein